MYEATQISNVSQNAAWMLIPFQNVVWNVVEMCDLQFSSFSI